MTAATVTITTTAPGRARAARPLQPASVQAPRRSASPLRLTRRGRAVVVLGTLAGAVIGVSAVEGTSQAAGHVHRQAPHTVTVQRGESLWQVAARVAPHADPRLIITEIEQANRLTGSRVFAGQQLVVPS